MNLKFHELDRTMVCVGKGRKHTNGKLFYFPSDPCMTHTFLNVQATKLRQQKYGGDHPLTKKSLDFFTVVYAEVGKQQYSGR